MTKDRNKPRQSENSATGNSLPVYVELGRQIAQNISAIQSAATTFREQMAEINSRISKFLVPENLQAMVAVAKYIELEITKMPKELCERNWFLPGAAPFRIGLEVFTRLKEGPEKVDSYMSDLIGENLAYIENEIVQLFPNREKILKDAFSAHREEKYTLSIPVFIVQADGIFWELSCLKNAAFSRKKAKQKTDYVRRMSSSRRSGEEFTLIPLTENSPLSTFYDPNAPATELNRHGVLHGLSTNYDSKLNSLKSISCLWFMAKCPREATI